MFLYLIALSLKLLSSEMCFDDNAYKFFGIYGKKTPDLKNHNVSISGVYCILNPLEIFSIFF